MQASTAEFKTLVEGVSTTIDHRVTITLPGGVYPDLTLTVEKLSIDASLTTDMPDGTRSDAGYPARTADLTLSGYVDRTDLSKTAAWLFNVFDPTSPLYRLPIHGAAVTIDAGVWTSVGLELIRQFTGTVDAITVDPDAGSVELACVDGRNQLRSLPSVPAVVTAPPYNAGLTVEYAMDALLRAATDGAISSWPAQRANCVLAVGMRASLWPEIGTLSTTSPVPAPAFTTGAMGTALQAAAGLGTIVYKLASSAGAFVYIEFWATANCPGIIIGTLSGGINAFCVAASGGAGGVAVQSIIGGTTDNWNTGLAISGPTRVQVLFNQAVGSASWNATVRVGASTVSSGTRTAAGVRPVTAYDTAAFLSSTGTTIEAIQITTETTMPVANTFTPQAVLDPSLNDLQVIPAMSGDPFQVIQQMCDAEQGVAGLDELGVFRFRNRVTLATSPVVRTVTSTASLQSLNVGSAGSALANHVIAGYTGWNYGTRATVWQNPGVWYVPRRSTITKTVTTDQLIAAIDPIVSPLPDPSSGAVAGDSYYRASQDAAGVSEHPGVLITAIQNSANQVTFTLQNSTALDAWLISAANHTDLTVGTPVLWLGGIPVTPNDEITSDRQWPPIADGGAASSTLGDIAYSLTGNPYMQDQVSADRIAVDLLSDLHTAPILLTNVVIMPDPRLQLTDRALLTDTTRTGMSEHVTVWSTSLTIEDGTYEQSLGLKMVAVAPNSWILGVSGRSELSTTTLL